MRDDTLKHAWETWQLIEEHGFKDFDLAYAKEAMARAYTVAENWDGCCKWHNKEKEASKLILGEDDKKYFDKKFSNQPWFGCI